jgi:hypothetical protein
MSARMGPSRGPKVQQADRHLEDMGHRWWPRQPSRRWTCAGAGMVRIPAATSVMGADRHYPQEPPARRAFRVVGLLRSSCRVRG